MVSLDILRLQIADFLATPIIVHPLIEIDLWMGVHFIVGILLALAIFKYKFLKKYKKNSLILVFVALIIYEIIELIVWSNPAMFNNFIPEPESLINMIWDVIFGMLGFLFYKSETE